MAAKKKTPPPLFAVKFNFIDSLDAFIQASMMLHNSITTILSLTKPGDPIPDDVRKMLKERADAWEKATLTDNQGEG